MRRISAIACSFAFLFGAASARGEEPRHFSNLLVPEAEFGEYGSDRAQLNTPLSVDIGSERTIYIADHKNHRIQVRNQFGRLLRNIGRQGTADGELQFPSSVVVINDKIFVADKGNSRIAVFKVDGTFLRNIDIRAKNGETVSPYYMDASDTRIALIPYDDPTLFVIDEDGQVTERVLPREIGGLPFDPGGIALVGEELILTDAASGRLVVFDRHGNVLRSAAEWGTHPGLLATPGGLSRTAMHIFVADQVNHRIQVFRRADLKFDFQWGRHPVTGHEGGGRLHYPGTVAVTDQEDFGVVCEPIEHRCQTFDLASLSKTPVTAVSETAWWEKRGRFHYGARTKALAGLLLVTEQDTHAVLAFDISGESPTLIRKFGGFGTEFGKFVMPSGPNFDPAKRLVSISDRGNNRIQQYALLRTDGLEKAAALEESTVIDLKTVLANSQDIPAGYDPTRVDPGPQINLNDGSMLVVDVAQGAFLRVDSKFRLLAPPILLEKGPSGFHRKPVSAEVTADGKFVYFVDPWSYQVVKASLDGKQILSWGKSGPRDDEFLFPFGITIDDEGNVFVSDTGKHSIKKFDKDGKFILEFGSYGVQEGQFYKPKGISFDTERKRLYVMDFGNHRAQVFDKDGTFILAFGIGEQYVPAANELVLKQPLISLATKLSTPTTNLQSGFAVPDAHSRDLFSTTQPIIATISTVDSAFSIQVKIASANFVAGTPSDPVISVIEDGRDVTSDVEIRVNASMPAHGHGLGEELQIERSAGQATLRNLNFTMPGDWQMEIYVGRGGVWHRAFADIAVTEN
ncbi:hypothetical protein [Mesorhizobium sp. M0227]|uniref:NHL repeat-containing protein n=1 Tax=Mesorhizobium sp. M0227 TaxID=2956922 RepID=UPI00333A2691